MSMLRGVSRCMGAAAVGAASVPSGAFCHVSSTSTINPREQLSSSLNSPHKELSSISHLPSKPLLTLAHDEAEDWEYFVHEESTERPLGHLVFSPAPTKEEVEDATKDLHAALTTFTGSSLDGSPDEPCLGVSESLSQQEDRGLLLKVRDKQEVRDTSFKPSSSHLGILAAGSSVYQAFHLMRSNPQVQGAVKSLACDPAVWKAVLDNEKVQELTQSLQNMAETSSYDELLCANSEINFGLKLASKVLVHVTSKVLQLMDKIIEIVGSVFEYLENSFTKKGTSVTDKAVASCLMLAVAVLLVVFIKRVVVK